MQKRLQVKVVAAHTDGQKLLADGRGIGWANQLRTFHAERRAAMLSEEARKPVYVRERMAT